jgi:hypothetical protein
VDCAAFQSLLEERMPTLAAHFETRGLGDLPSMFLPRWMLCLFLNVTPAWITLRVWDALLLDGPTVSGCG